MNSKKADFTLWVFPLNTYLTPNDANALAFIEDLYEVETIEDKTGPRRVTLTHGEVGVAIRTIVGWNLTIEIKNWTKQ